MNPTDTTTLGDAKAWTRDRAEKGVCCPLCTQNVRVYKRPLYGGMVYPLFILRDASPEYIHVSDELKAIGTRVAMASAQSADWCKMAGWGFIEPMTADRDDGSDRNGWWKITQQGNDFVSELAGAPKYVRTYAGRVMGVTGEVVWIRDVIGETFDYDQLMGSNAA